MLHFLEGHRTNDLLNQIIRVKITGLCTGRDCKQNAKEKEWGSEACPSRGWKDVWPFEKGERSREKS